MGASFAVSIEAGLIHHTFRREEFWLDDLLRYIVPEVFLMVIVMRLATAITGEATPLIERARGWLYDPLSIFDIAFVCAVLLGLLFLVAFPFLWLLAIPFRIVGALIEALLALVRALLFLPARLLGG